MKKDRFDLEQEIMNCWQVTDDIKAIYTYHLDKKELTEDELGNILIGLEKLYQIKFEMLWDTFESLVRARQLDNEVKDEQSKARESQDRYAAGYYELGN